MTNKGLTLVEVTVSSALVLLIVTALLGAQVSSRYLTRKVRVNFEAANVAQSILEQEKSRDYADIQTRAVTQLVSDNGTPQDPADDINGTVDVNVTTSPTGSTKTIAVQVSWNHVYFGIERRSAVNLSTIVSNIS